MLSKYTPNWIIKKNSEEYAPKTLYINYMHGRIYHDYFL